MVRVHFQNGAEAPVFTLEEEFDTRAAAEKRIPWIVENYGTVADAHAWVEGDPKHVDGRKHRTRKTAVETVEDAAEAAAAADEGEAPEK